MTDKPVTTNNVIEFRKKVKDQAPVGTLFVMITINDDGSDAYLEYTASLNGYEVLGILAYAQSLKLAETELMPPDGVSK